MKLAEALDPELPPERAKEVIDEYLSVYNDFYLQNMRKKLGLLKKEEPEDELLVTELLQTMHNTGGVAAGHSRIYTTTPFGHWMALCRFFGSDSVCPCWLQVQTSPTLSAA